MWDLAPEPMCLTFELESLGKVASVNKPTKSSKSELASQRAAGEDYYMQQ